MDRLLPLLTLIVTASISVGGPAIAEWRLAGPLSSSFVTDSDAAIVFIAGKGGGGGTTGGMSGGGTTGGMSSGGSTGGMSSGGSTGGMSGGGSTGGMGSGTNTGGMGWGTGGGWGGFGDSASPVTGGFGTTSGGNPSWNNAQPAYYTDQCVTPAGQCSFTAPASLRSSSLSAGARCACAVGQPEGRVR